MSNGKQGANVIECPKCRAVLAEGDATFKEKQPDYPYFDLTCAKCSHEFRAHHKDWYKKPGNPFFPAKLSLG